MGVKAEKRIREMEEILDCCLGHYVLRQCLCSL